MIIDPLSNPFTTPTPRILIRLAKIFGARFNMYVNAGTAGLKVVLTSSSLEVNYCPRGLSVVGSAVTATSHEWDLVALEPVSLN